MKKLLILSFLLYSLSGFSQTITLVNNTSDVIVIDQLWLNEFCSYNFPGVQPQVPATPLVTTLIGPSSAAVIFTITGPGMLSAIPYDFEYIKLNVMQIIGGTLGAPLPLSDLGTEPTVYYNPASCEPITAPTTSPMPLPPLTTGIRQVILVDGPPFTPAPSSITAIVGGKLYFLTWTTIYDPIFDKYDVEINVN